MNARERRLTDGFLPCLCHPSVSLESIHRKLVCPWSVALKRFQTLGHKSSSTFGDRPWTSTNFSLVCESLWGEAWVWAQLSKPTQRLPRYARGLLRRLYKVGIFFVPFLLHHLESLAVGLWRRRHFSKLEEEKNRATFIPKINARDGEAYLSCDH